MEINFFLSFFIDHYYSTDNVLVEYTTPNPKSTGTHCKHTRFSDKRILPDFFIMKFSSSTYKIQLSAKDEKDFNVLSNVLPSSPSII